MIQRQQPKVKRSPTSHDSSKVFALPRGDSEEIQPSKLLLDPRNLRLLEVASESLADTPAPLIGQKALQDRVSSLILNDPVFALTGLRTSITTNGFLRHERLIVARYDATQFVVLEGNRRLTAVRSIFQLHGVELSSLRPEVRQSLQTLPCYILDGDPIDGNEEHLEAYRRAAEIFIGMRHLMGARHWEPASRYEFQARLIDEGWTPEQVAERFDRKKQEVRRDLQAHHLYRDFVKFEHTRHLGHTLTYNAFAEAARASSIMTWLGWSSERMAIANREREAVFFDYLAARIKAFARAPVDGEDGPTTEESAESAVRRLRDMLKLDDPDIEGALLDRQFEIADSMYEDRKEGLLAKRLSSYVRGLKRITASELTGSPHEIQRLLRDLINQATTTLDLLSGVRQKGK